MPPYLALHHGCSRSALGWEWRRLQSCLSRSWPEPEYRGLSEQWEYWLPGWEKASPSPSRRSPSASPASDRSLQNRCRVCSSHPGNREQGVATQAPVNTTFHFGFYTSLTKLIHSNKKVQMLTWEWSQHQHIDYWKKIPATREVHMAWSPIMSCNSWLWRFQGLLEQLSGPHAYKNFRIHRYRFFKIDLRALSCRWMIL